MPTDIPTFAPHMTERRARRLLMGPDNHPLEGLISRWVTADLTEKNAQEAFIDHLRQLLGKDAHRGKLLEVRRKDLRQSCQDIFVPCLQEGQLRFWAWRMAANIDRLQRKYPLVKWVGPAKPTWAPVQIDHGKVGLSVGMEPKRGIIYTFRIIDGMFCPATFDRWFGEGHKFVMARTIGMRRRRAPQGFSTQMDRLELVGMRMVAQISSDPLRRDRLTFEKYAAGQFKGYNRRLEKARDEKCPEGHTWACHKCPRGADTCPTNKPGTVGRACRPLTLEKKGCNACHAETWHDGPECLPCRVRSASR